MVAFSASKELRWRLISASSLLQPPVSLHVFALRAHLVCCRKYYFILLQDYYPLDPLLFLYYSQVFYCFLLLRTTLPAFQYYTLPFLHWQHYCSTFRAELDPVSLFTGFFSHWFFTLDEYWSFSYGYLDLNFL